MLKGHLASIHSQVGRGNFGLMARQGALIRCYLSPEREGDTCDAAPGVVDSLQCKPNGCVHGEWVAGLSGTSLARPPGWMMGWKCGGYCTVRADASSRNLMIGRVKNPAAEPMQNQSYGENGTVCKVLRHAATSAARRSRSSTGIAAMLGAAE